MTDPTVPTDAPHRTDPGLDAAVAAYRALLAPDPVLEFPVTALDRVGVPVWCNWWSAGRPGFGGVGYGGSDLQARVSALGELVEHVCARRTLRTLPREAGSLRELRRRHGAEAVVDPRRLGLPAGTPFDDDRPLEWWPVRRLRDGARMWAPAEYVAGSPADLAGPPPPGGWTTVAVSNGLGAGTSLDQAVAHGVLEVVQRDGNGLSFRALDTGRAVELDGVTDPVTLDALEALRRAGVEVVVKLASTDFGMANVDVVGTAPGDDVLSATACGEAVHPDREVAVRKAVLEFAAARARKQLMHGPVEAVLALAPPEYAEVVAGVDPAAEEQRVLRAMVAWLGLAPDAWRPLLEDTVLARSATVPFPALPTTPVPRASLLDDVCGRLAAEGYDVLVHELTPAGTAGAHAVKVLVPGLEVETVAYGRLGDRNAARLVAAGRDDLVRVGPRPPGWQRVHVTEAGREALGGEVWLDREALDALPGPLFPLYREPGRHAAPLARRAAAGGGQASRT